MALLAHLISQFRGKQEDIATLSLQYILSQSPELRDRFTQEVASLLSISLDTLDYRCQVTGTERERPDMAGYDTQNQEQVLFEMKFYAGLTDNQPNGYLDRARKNHGKGLLFVCPPSSENPAVGRAQRHLQGTVSPRNFFPLYGRKGNPPGYLHLA